MFGRDSSRPRADGAVEDDPLNGYYITPRGWGCSHQRPLLGSSITAQDRRDPVPEHLVCDVHLDVERRQRARGPDGFNVHPNRSPCRDHGQVDRLAGCSFAWQQPTGHTAFGSHGEPDLRFRDTAGGDDGAYTQWLVQAVQAEGTCYPTPSVWRGGPVMRISVSNHRTTSEDVQRSVAAIARLHAAGRG